MLIISNNVGRRLLFGYKQAIHNSLALGGLGIWPLAYGSYGGKRPLTVQTVWLDIKHIMSLWRQKNQTVINIFGKRADTNEERICGRCFIFLLFCLVLFIFCLHFGHLLFDEEDDGRCIYSLLGVEGWFVGNVINLDWECAVNFWLFDH